MGRADTVAVGDGADVTGAGVELDWGLGVVTGVMIGAAACTPGLLADVSTW
jgi:hypothetical protein